MDDVEQIKQKINIVDLIQEYLPLKKSGINYKANCPFHQEKTPSFMISPERGIWHCFGCAKGGDIFKFIMEKEGFSFPESLEMLAKKAGIVLTRQTKSPDDPTKALLEIHQKAAEFFHFILTTHPTGKKSLAYLKKRGLTEETIKGFNLGYAPVSWENLTKFLRKRGFTIEQIIASGVTVPSNSGGYDRFRGRIIFPLKNIRQEIVGFSGRVLDSGEPKYINSPQTAIFDKSKFLFGIAETKQAIRDAGEAILVEGEMDMLLSYQSGVKNIVATKGTALTTNQIELLKRYTDTLSLCFDTDLAGDAAARRGIEIADDLGLNLKVVQLKGGKDPADICLKDPELWIKAVKDAVAIYDYYLDSAKKRYDPKTPLGKKQIFHELIPVWQKITDPIIRDQYIQKLAALLQTSDELIQQELSKPVKAAIPGSSLLSATAAVADSPVEQKSRQELLEEYLMSLLLHPPKTHNFVPNFPETLFSRDDLRQLYVLLVLYLDQISFAAKDFKINNFVDTLNESLTTLVDRIFLYDLDPSLQSATAWQKEITKVTTELKKLLIKSSLERLSYKIKTAQAFNQAENLNLLNKRFRDLSVKLKNL